MKAGNGKTYFDVDTQIQFILDGIMLQCKLILPKSGRFENQEDLSTREVFDEETTINFGAAFPIGEA